MAIEIQMNCATGELSEITYTPVAPTITSEMIDAERDRRMASGIEFNGVRYQTRPGDRENIQGAFSLATAWIMIGGDPTSLLWHGGLDDFGWIAEDNTVTPMSAATVMSFGQATAAMKSRLTFAGRALKDTLPADYTSDAYWS
jgi:hypothetical protein